MKVKKFCSIVFLCIVGITFTSASVLKSKAQQDVEQVLQRLISAIGDKNPVPTIEVWSSMHVGGAGYNPASNTIIVEELALQACQKMGQDSESALAFLIGHELTHYYQKHDWETPQGFASTFLSTSEIFTSHIKEEEEADIYGSFIAHVAGYSIDILPRILEQIYVDYNHDDNKLRHSYPSLEERMRIVMSATEQVHRLIQIHDAGNLAFSVGDYANALSAYEYLLKSIRFKEIYNNIGAACLASLLQSGYNKKYAFDYPITIAAELPLRQPNAMEQQQLLNRAIEVLNEAIAYDPYYYTGMLNLACIYELSDQKNNFFQLLNHLKQQRISPSLDGKLLIIEAIFEANNYNTSTAENLFKNVEKMNVGKNLRLIAKNNRKTLRKHNKGKNATMLNRTIINDRIDEIRLLTYSRTVAPLVTFKDYQNTGSLQVHDGQRSKIFIFNKGSHQAKIQYTKNPSLRTTVGIQVGSPLEQIQEAYGEATPILLSDTSYYLYYANNGLVFHLDKLDKVIGWGIAVL